MDSKKKNKNVFDDWWTFKKLSDHFFTGGDETLVLDKNFAKQHLQLICLNYEDNHEKLIILMAAKNPLFGFKPLSNPRSKMKRNLF